MTCLDNDEVFAVMGIGAVAVDRDLTADPAMVEREGAKVLRDQDDGIALTLIGAEGARRHHALAFKAEESAKVVKPRDKQTVPHGIRSDPQILDHPLHRKACKPPV